MKENVLTGLITRHRSLVLAIIIAGVAGLMILLVALPPKRDVMLYLTAISGLSQELGVSFGGISLEGGEIKAASTSATTKGKTARTPDLKLDSLYTESKITGSQERIYAFLRTGETT